jgi:hypothetical protein
MCEYFTGIFNLQVRTDENPTHQVKLTGMLSDSGDWT